MNEICSNSLSSKRWTLRSYEESNVLALMQRLEVSPLLARLLAMRGYTHETAPTFLEPRLKDHLPDPLVLKDMDKAIERILKAIENDEKILIWGDYDVDGATSSALLSRFFGALGKTVALYIPDRMKEGYGPNAAGVAKFEEQGYTLMITVDCGTTSFEVLEGAQKMDVIVLDHHAPEAKLPKVYALVNPNRLDETEENTKSLGHLAAVGICFLCIVALNRALRKKGYFETHQEPDLMSLLDLVALGTVCDVMPLKGLNRTFVSQGLKVAAQRKNHGIKALADHAGLDEAPTPYHLGFVIGPRINAGGRVGEAFLGARLLSTDKGEEASQIANKLGLYNQERQALEKDALNEAYVQANPAEPAIVVDRDGWHEGVIGILAGRLKDKFQKPTAVITWNDEGMGKGSARSIPGFDFGRFIHRALHKGYLERGGGHAMAAGFALTKEQLAPFVDFLKEEVTTLQEEVDLKPVIVSDGYLDLRSLNPELFEEIQRLAPFGMGNPQPKFIFSDLVVESYTLIQDQHIRCRFTQGDGISVEGIGFRLNGTPFGEKLMEGKRRPLHLIAAPQLNTWRGRTKVMLQLEDAVETSTPLLKAGGWLIDKDFFD